MELKIIELWNKLKPNSPGITIQNIGSIQLTDFDFLQKPEKEINSKGEILKQSYTFNGDEVLFIRYNKLFDTITIDGTEYPDEFIGYYDEIVYLDTKGNEALSKIKQRVNFSLTPYVNLIGNFVGLSSVKRNDYLNNERVNWAKKMRDANPFMFSLIRRSYTDEYLLYIDEGDKTGLINRINIDKDYDGSEPEILLRKEVFNKLFEDTPFKVYEVIISTLQ